MAGRRLPAMRQPAGGGRYPLGGGDGPHPQSDPSPVHGAGPRPECSKRSFCSSGIVTGAEATVWQRPQCRDWQERPRPGGGANCCGRQAGEHRADAAFALSRGYTGKSPEIDYAIRLPANEVLQRKIAQLLTRPTEGPSPKPIVSYHGFTYQAQSWNVSRRRWPRSSGTRRSFPEWAS